MPEHEIHVELEPERVGPGCWPLAIVALLGGILAVLATIMLWIRAWMHAAAGDPDAWAPWF